MILKRSSGGALIWVTSDSGIRRRLAPVAARRVPDLKVARVSVELIDQVMRDSS